MRTSNKIIILFLSILALFFNVSCDNPEEDIFKTFSDFQFIAFENYSSTSFNGVENSGTITIPFSITNLSQSDITVNFSVEDSTAIEGTHYFLANSSVTIPSGDYEGSVEIDFVDNDVFNETRFFTITMSSVSDTNYNIGTGLEGSFSKLVGIVNDDCPSQTNLWWGDLNVEDVGFGNLPGTGSPNSAGDCDVLIVNSDLPNAGIGAVPFELQFTPSGPGATNGTVEVPEQLYCSSCSAGLDGFYSASGTYDETTQTIILFYSFVRSDGATFWTGTNIITVL